MREEDAGESLERRRAGEEREFRNGAWKTETIFLAPAGERPRRREELIEMAEEHLGMQRVDAERIYEIAREEHLEPALAFELVRSGLAVSGLEVPDAEPIVDVGEPTWVEPVDAASAENVERERKLRASFRRLRGLTDRHPAAEKALEEYAAEPDVEPSGF